MNVTFKSLAVDVKSGLRSVLFSVATIVAIIGLASCATAAPAPQIDRLTAETFPPTPTVDLLVAPPGQPYIKIARLVVQDPTGTAARDQLIAQLVDAARGLGANALVVQQVQRDDSSRIAFDPAGGQMQGGQQVASTTVTALAIRYTH